MAGIVDEPGPWRTSPEQVWMHELTGKIHFCLAGQRNHRSKSDGSNADMNSIVALPRAFGGNSRDELGQEAQFKRYRGHQAVTGGINVCHPTVALHKGCVQTMFQLAERERAVGCHCFLTPP